jgi:glycine cleavage system H protein
MSMSEIVSNLLYTQEHEWVEVLSETRVRIGITHFAQDQLGDIVFVELPSVGTSITAGQSIGSVESVKTVSDLFSPVTGKVASINEALEAAPEKVNEGPYGAGWMAEVEISGADALQGLLKAEEYEAFIGSEH